MSTKLSMIQTFCQYTSWANERLFETATHLSPEQLGAAQGEMGESVYALLTHLLVVQVNWLQRLGAEIQAISFTPSQEPDISILIKGWHELDRATQSYLATLAESDLDAPKRYVNDRGEVNVYARWQILFHLVNHAAQHRSEVALLLTRYGFSPGWFDFPYYLDERDGTTIHDETNS